MRRWRAAAFAGAAALATSIAVASCGTDDSYPSESAQTTTSAAARPTEPATSDAGEAGTGRQPTSVPEVPGRIPAYQPSTEISRAPGSAVLTTSDPLEKVSDFYVDFVDREGWQSVSRSLTPYSTSLTVRKDGEGASISVSVGGDGTLISISTYPSP